ncbi:ubiquinol-cytochrome c reductase complex 17 kd protein [Morchella snyderi]|nr:ubiquinol-cytochrome c reductase complex 17 kd protein [Morchella snyderi]
MSLSSFISDIYNSLSISEVHAEAPPTEEKEPQTQEQEPKEEKEETEEEPEKEEAAEEEEEEEEEEPQDPAPAITEECANSKECRPYKHHYDECVERVTAAASEENATGPKEDCVEEFFHVLHCATACAAPKIFAKLK